MRALVLKAVPCPRKTPGVRGGQEGGCLDPNASHNLPGRRPRPSRALLPTLPQRRTRHHRMLRRARRVLWRQYDSRLVRAWVPGGEVFRADDDCVVGAAGGDGGEECEQVCRATIPREIPSSQNVAAKCCANTGLGKGCGCGLQKKPSGMYRMVGQALEHCSGRDERAWPGM